MHVYDAKICICLGRGIEVYVHMYICLHMIRHVPIHTSSTTIVCIAPLSHPSSVMCFGTSIPNCRTR